MIELRDLEFSYDPSSPSALRMRIPSLTLESGKRVVVIGPSGCGKTTFLHLIAGILKPQKGTIQVNNLFLTKQSARALRDFRISSIGFIFQTFELVEYLTVRENIYFPFYLNPRMRKTAEIEEEFSQLTERLGLSLQLKKFPHQLSQGEQQRVGMARALITQAPLIIADEPTGNLDPVATLEAMELLESTCKQKQATLLMVTHNHSLIQRFDEVLSAEEWQVKK